jgi:hypothetical protein
MVSSMLLVAAFEGFTMFQMWRGEREKARENRTGS